MSRTDSITADAVRIGLEPHKDNAHAAQSHVAPAVWYFGTLAQCRKLAAVSGLDIERCGESAVSTHADLYKDVEWAGFIANPTAQDARHSIRIGRPAI